MQQLQLKFDKPTGIFSNIPYRHRLVKLLESDLGFHGQNGNYSTHGWHAFPAKFPPQLPRKFILELTEPGDSVLDPMMGSGTTLVEAMLLERKPVGCDLDPLSLRIVMAKLNFIDLPKIAISGKKITIDAKATCITRRKELLCALENRFDEATHKFINYWFDLDTQLELLALVQQIEQIKSKVLRKFFTLVFSSIIITKTGGVSLAVDLAHTRPHKSNEKKPNSAISAFHKRYRVIVQDLNSHQVDNKIFAADAQSLPLESNCIDLIVTSPPYANNAIDYMRAHKFTLVWLGFSINDLTKLRSQYIGKDTTSSLDFSPLPDYSWCIINKLLASDKKKGLVLHRYYSEMKQALFEMNRVLKPGKAAIVVVGTSILRGINTETHNCLAEIGQGIGFELVGIGTRQLDRDKRMMPARWKVQKDSQIESRMHEEYVIAFLKP